MFVEESLHSFHLLWRNVKCSWFSFHVIFLPLQSCWHRVESLTRLSVCPLTHGWRRGPTLTHTHTHWEDCRGRSSFMNSSHTSGRFLSTHTHRHTQVLAQRCANTWECSGAMECVWYTDVLEIQQACWCWCWRAPQYTLDVVPLSWSLLKISLSASSYFLNVACHPAHCCASQFVVWHSSFGHVCFQWFSSKLKVPGGSSDLVHRSQCKWMLLLDRLIFLSP